MYLFTETIFSQCPHENYCVWMSILGIILFPIQVSLAAFLISHYKNTKSEYIQFMAFFRIISAFLFTFQSIVVEIRTFFPRKTIICYGLVRFLGDTFCQLSLVCAMVYIMLEFCIILFAFNGQYNNICRKTGFYNNNWIQNTSFFIFFITIVAYFTLFMFSFIPREEGISKLYMKHNDMKAFANGSYIIVAIGESKENISNGIFIIAAIYLVHYITHFSFVFCKMGRFIFEMKELGKNSSLRQSYINKFIHHLINVSIPMVIVFIPLVNLCLCFFVFYQEELYWLTKVTTNSIMFCFYINEIVSPFYTFYFILTSNKTKIKIILSSKITKVLKKKNSNRNLFMKKEITKIENFKCKK
uniref:G_PROTEIN_RECEP_F1_2 domain-containing protein n=1 Tax=Strongyloides papillosus TaxID=174720 RepID=A0A0N5CIL0_STREA